MRWLRRLCRMEDNQQPKLVLFGELVKARPFQGDVVYNVFLNCGCGCSFHQQGDLTYHSNFCTG